MDKDYISRLENKIRELQVKEFNIRNILSKQYNEELSFELNYLEMQEEKLLQKLVLELDKI